jgi:beta-phosphoglucomutase-like phosphatase (HAD superfamily)
MNRATSSSACLRPTPPDSCIPPIPDGVRALVFDFDGTLADTTSSHERALRAALQPYGVDLDPDWYRRRVGLSIHDLLAAIPGASDLPHDEIIRHSRTHLLTAVHTITPVPCVVSLLHAARRAQLPCAVASGASQLLVRPGIAALGLSDEFAVVVAREDVARGKPSPDLFTTAARRLGLQPECCLAVDDARDGIAAARAAGMRAITVIDGHLAPADGAAVTPLHAAADVVPSHPAPVRSGTARTRQTRGA